MKKSFLQQVQDERERQIRPRNEGGKGYTAEMDDRNGNALALAAASYAIPYFSRIDRNGDYCQHSKLPPRTWPADWSDAAWKPCQPMQPADRQNEIVKVCALMYADWDRLERVRLRNEAHRKAMRERLGLDNTLAEAAVTEPEDIKTDVLPAEAIIGFASWLTTREAPVTISAWDDAAKVAELADQYIKCQGWQAAREDFTDRLQPGPQPKPLTLEDCLHSAPELETTKEQKNPFQKIIDLNDPSTLESPFEKAIRESVEKNQEISKEAQDNFIAMLNQHQQKMKYVQKCPACKGEGFTTVNESQDLVSIRVYTDGCNGIKISITDHKTGQEKGL